MKTKNPNWNRDELILALDLYFQERDAIGNNKHPSIIELSLILNKMYDRSYGEKNANFRNPNGVAMKLSNYTRFDPQHKSKGLERGGKLEKEIWDYFSPRPKELQNVASRLREYATNPLIVSEFESQDDNYRDEAQEGRTLTKIHSYRERNPKIVRDKKRSILKQTGSLKCEVCSFDFAKVYGNLGSGYAECHHIIPLSELQMNQKTKLSDLAIVCSNCHSMIHRSKPWLTIEELKKILRANNTVNFLSIT